MIDEKLIEELAGKEKDENMKNNKKISLVEYLESLPTGSMLQKLKNGWVLRIKRPKATGYKDYTSIRSERVQDLARGLGRRVRLV